MASTFTARFGFTKNLGNFESARFDLEETFQVGTITEEEAFRILRQKVLNAAQKMYGEDEVPTNDH